MTLAKLWDSTADVGVVEAEAGRRLLAGETLPINPTPGESSGAEPRDPYETRQVEAFFAAGYDYDDAVRLAELWRESGPFEAKVAAGKKVLAADTLPIWP